VKSLARQREKCRYRGMDGLFVVLGIAGGAMIVAVAYLIIK
jgi:hypothetical protein